MEKVFIIAEAGVNHNGSVVVAKKMIDVAFKSGADAVKFQTFTAEKVISKFAPKADYQKRSTGANESQLEMAKKLELNKNAHKEIMQYCQEKGILFLSTAFDLDSIDLLVDLGITIYKIPSGEITNLPYLRKIGSLRKKIIMSTGMSYEYEVKDALGVLIDVGMQKKDITLLHCNTEYPTPYEDVNLSAMLTMKDVFNVKVGYSDHSCGIEVPIAAVALGAVVIEKHFTLDKNMQGPDHSASLSPDEFADMVNAIRNIEKVLGTAVKRPSPSESKNIIIARKSIVAVRDIQKEERFTNENITVKRPGTGINPMKWNDVIGMKAKRFFKEDEVIEL